MADSFYANIAVLLHCDGTNGSTTFTDNGPLTKTVNVGGSAVISTANPKFGSGAFEGSSDANSGLKLDGSSAFAFGTGDFTVEFWARRDDSGTRPLYSTIPVGGSTTGTLLIEVNGGVTRVVIEGSAVITGTGLYTIGVWNHIALTRSGTNLKLFFNGTQEGGTATNSTNLIANTDCPSIGLNLNSAILPFTGGLDDIRVTKGVARYTSNFTAPTEAFEDTGATGSGAIVGNVPLSTSVNAAMHKKVRGSIVAATTAVLNVASTLRRTRQTLIGAVPLSLTPNATMGKQHKAILGSVPLGTTVSGTELKYHRTKIIGSVPLSASINATLFKYKHPAINGAVPMVIAVSSVIGINNRINLSGEFITTSLDAATGYRVDDAGFISTSLSATMRSEYLNIAGGFINTTLDAATGWRAAGGFLATELSSTGTLIETMTVNASFIETTLSSSVNVDERITSSFGFISSTLTSLGGWNATGDFPVFGLASTVTVDSNRINVSGSFLETSVAFSGTMEQRITVAGGFIDTYLAYSSVAGGFISTSLSAAGSEAITPAVAYVMNVHTTESTRYSNFPFLHIVHIGGKPYGVKADGLYLLEGATDSGAPISGSATTKCTDFGSFNSKHVNEVYLDSDTATTITPTVDDVLIAQSYPSSFGGRRVAMARGLEGRYWSFRIDGIQKLQGIEISPLIRQRKVK